MQKPLIMKNAGERTTRMALSGAELAKQALWMLAGFLLALCGALGGMSPFCVALTAFAPAGRLLACFVGSCGGVLVTHSGTRAISLIASLIIAATLNQTVSRFRSMHRLEFIHPCIALTSCAAAGFTVLAAQGISIDGSLSVIAESMISAGAAYFYYRAYSVKSLLREPSVLSVQELSSIVVAACTLLVSVSRLTVGGASPARFLAVLLVLFCARYARAAGGAVAGVCAGFALSLADGMGHLSGAYSFAGLLAGMFAPVGQLASAAAFVASNAVVAILNSGENDILITLWEAAAASIAFVAIPSKLLVRGEKYFSPAAKQPTILAMKNSLLLRLNSAAAGLNEVAGTVDRVSESLTRIEKKTGGAATRRVVQMQEIVRDQFRTLSTALGDISDDLSSTAEFDTAAAGRVVSALASFGIHSVETCCTVDGEGRVCIKSRVKPIKSEIDKLALMRSVERAVSRRLNYPSVENLPEETLLTFSQLTEYAVNIGSAQHPGGGNTICGDYYESFNDAAGRQIIVLSDGMGSGARAAIDSAMTAGLFVRLLKSGFSFESALKLVNSALIVKSEEESLATLDVACIDLYSGELTLFKAGASATLVSRGKRLITVEKPSMPAGILKDITFETERIKLLPGDTVLMFSDGVEPDSFEELGELLFSKKIHSPSELAEKAVDIAMENSQGIRTDDITVIAARISE